MLLDKQLVPKLWMMSGPCEMTSQLLTILATEASSQDCSDDPFEVANDILGALSRVETDAPCAVLGLLGILLDAMAELGCLDVSSDREVAFRDTAVMTLIRTIWRRDKEIRIAAGILERLEARHGGLGFAVSASGAHFVISELVREAESPEQMAIVCGADPLEGVSTFFGFCLRVMQKVDEPRALDTIHDTLMRPLSVLLSTLLERTTQVAMDKRLEELDVVATCLYDHCCQIVHSAQSAKPMRASIAFPSYV